MALLHQIRLSHKFLVLGFVAVVMVAFPSYMYLERTLVDVAASKLERKGVTPLIALIEVIRFSQIHRGMSASMLNGNAELEARRPALRDKVSAAMALVDTEFKAAEVIPALQTRWADIKQKWITVEQGVGSKSLTTPQSTAQHTQMITLQIQLGEELLDEYRLSQDIGADTYPLIRATLNDMPWLAENMGIMRAMGSGFLTKGAAPPEGKATLAALYKRAQEVKVSMQRQVMRATNANPVLKAELESRSQGIFSAVDKALAVAKSEIMDAAEVKMPAVEYFDVYTRTIDGLFEFNTLAMKALVNTLDARIAREQRMQLTIGGIVLGGLVIALCMSIVFTRSITSPLTHAGKVANAVATGHLDMEVVVLGSNELGQLLQSLKDMEASLSEVVTKVRTGAEGVATASAEIALGDHDMSARIESQASALQETAATMMELSSTVSKNADSAREANQLALDASKIAAKGGEVVAQVVDTMKGINDSSRRIADIIGVIDGIAFQTNILALNAAVEAARAGEQGRGFAVVASEVRSLAGRSAEAAKEIKALIGASVERVEHGSALVDQAGITMTQVVSSIRRVTGLMGEISSASSEQALSVAQVGEAVKQMDDATQQSAALVEQIAAAASSLQGQAQDLVETVAVFHLSAQPHRAVAAGQGAFKSQRA